MQSISRTKRIQFSNPELLKQIQLSRDIYIYMLLFYCYNHFMKFGSLICFDGIMIICCNFLHQKIDKMATFFNLRMVFMLHLKRGKNVLIKFMYGIHIVII